MLPIWYVTTYMGSYKAVESVKYQCGRCGVFISGEKGLVICKHCGASNLVK